MASDKEINDSAHAKVWHRTAVPASVKNSIQSAADLPCLNQRSVPLFRTDKTEGCPSCGWEETVLRGKCTICGFIKDPGLYAVATGDQAHHCGNGDDCVEDIAELIFSAEHGAETEVYCKDVTLPFPLLHRGFKIAPVRWILERLFFIPRVILRAVFYGIVWLFDDR